MDNVGGTRRAALWTIGRGSRALLRFFHEGLEYVIAGTNIATGNNKVHILRADEEENDFKSVGIYDTDAEVWSIDLVSVSEDTVSIMAATRRKRRSAAELWSLSLVDAPNTDSIYGSPGSKADDAVRSIDVMSSVDLEGNAIKVSRHALDRNLYLAVTNSAIAVLNVDENSVPKLSISPLGDKLRGGTDRSAIVDSGWIGDSHFFIAHERFVDIYDSKTGYSSTRLTPSEIVANSWKDEGKQGTAPLVSKITSACVNVGENMLCIGGQDGSLRAFDIRELWGSHELPGGATGDGGWVTRISWEVLKGHSQWISVLAAMPDGGFLSGDIDGLVRRWTKDGSPSGIFPQHVDTVTGATTSSKSFITISYDGRIALNQIPVGT